MKETLKTVGSFFVGLLFLVGCVLVALLFINGGAWLSDMVYPWLVGLSVLAAAVSVLVFLPLAAFRKTRGFSGAGFYATSYVFGATLWVWSFLLTYALWGGIALFIGLFFAGVGVVPIAMLATAFKGMWPFCGQLMLLLVITFGTRLFGAFLIAKAEEHAYEVA